MQSRNARIGLLLFFIYFAVYAGYVLTNAFAPEMMERTPFAGVNLAIWYGMGLIVFALIMALIYGFLCDPHDDQPVDPKGGK
jgi:uncharacterized membrane protein (DUF485 family)